MKTFWFFGTDPGGVGNVVPIVRAMPPTACYELFGNGTAPVAFDAAGLRYTATNSTNEVLASGPPPDVVVTTMDAPDKDDKTIAIGELVIERLRRNSYNGTIVLVTDFATSGTIARWKAKGLYSDYALVNDAYGQDILAKAWAPNFQREQAIITGFAKRDANYITVSQAPDMHDELRKDYGISPDTFLPAFFGDVWGTTEALYAVDRALANDVPLLVRAHPRMELYDKEEFDRFRRLLAAARRRRLIIDYNYPLPILKAIAMSDLAFGLYSGAFDEIVDMGKDCVNMAFPEARRKFLADKAGVTTVFQHTMLGTCAEVGTDQELRWVIADAKNGDLRRRLGPCQAKIQNDGHNTQRAGNFLLSLPVRPR